MARQWWNKPVTIETRNLGRFVTINSTERAAQYMLQEWPAGEESGEAFDAAKKALMDAYDGKVSIDHARRALMAAAEEAGIFFYKDLP